MNRLSKTNRSGGPRTAEGKAIAARNSLKTGVYAASVVMPDESEQDFLELRDTLLVELRAAGVLEAALVNELAVITWKKARLDRLEHRVIMQRLNARPTVEDFFEGGLDRTPENEWILNHLNSLTPELKAEIQKREQLAREMMGPQTRASAINQIQQQLPDVFEQMIDWVRDERDAELLRNIDGLALMRERKSAAITGNYLGSSSFQVGYA